MSIEQTRRSAALTLRAAELSRRWLELCAQHLPVAAGGSTWRYSRAGGGEDPEQGWKLHVSATVLNAARVLERIAPALASRGVIWKAPATLDDLLRLNEGLDGAYSQVGKVFTVYPRDDGEALSLARLLHKLTRRLLAPPVPFDQQFRPRSNVYYRYGGFKPLEIERPDGKRVAALRDPSGRLVPDPSEAWTAPEGVPDPFAAESRRGRARPPDGAGDPLRISYKVFRALAQRGKGGVYQAVDLSAEGPRLCLLKEGRRGGEVGWDGRDGRRRVMHEGRVLSLLGAGGVAVPRVYSSFELDGNYYLVTEYIDGESLLTFLHKQRRRLPVGRALRLALQLCTFISEMHAAGWVWGDCKPSNLLLTEGWRLRPLDFEGAFRVGRRRPTTWATPAFTPPEEPAAHGADADLYALGAVTYLLLTGKMPERASAPPPASRLRRNVPREVCELVSELLGAGSRGGADARAVARRLEAALEGAPRPASRAGRHREFEPAHEVHETALRVET